MSSIGQRPKFWRENLTTSELIGGESSWKDFGTSMNAISVGFVATAILVSMFLIMAIFEHLLKPKLSESTTQDDVLSSMHTGQHHVQMNSLGKISNSLSVTVPYQPGFSVLMPGQLYPTYLAQPAPLPCSREEIYWPSHAHHTFISQ
ncbi:uncharacterized protein [Typha angustifolia]|uniref:uncharacterized protein n=1 Tax=Typha angustifolia TaxID=59011 RepID=UPI003C2D8BAE